MGCTPSRRARSALGDAARREVGIRYSFERMVGAFQALYESELETHHALDAQTAQAGI